MEFYNSFTSNFMSQKYFNVSNCDINDYSLFETKKYSSNICSFDYIRRIANEMKNVEMEEIKINKDKITKNKSITCLFKKAEIILDDRKPEFPFKSENRREVKLSLNPIKSTNNLNESLSTISQFNYKLKYAHLGSGYNFENQENLKFSKKKLSSPIENLNKLETDKSFQNKDNLITFKKREQEVFSCDCKTQSNIDTNNQDNYYDNNKSKNLKVIFPFVINENKNNNIPKIDEKIFNAGTFQSKDNHKNNTIDNTMSSSQTQGKDLEKLLMEKILQNRKSAIKKIINNYIIHKENKIKKEEDFINLILKERRESSTLIQSAFRSYFIRKNIKQLLNKLNENYIFIYDYNRKYFQNRKSRSSGTDKTINNANLNHSLNNNATGENPSFYDEEPNHDIKLKLINKKGKYSEILNLEYCKFLKSYVLIFKKKGLIRKSYRVNFIVNGNVIIDPRYKLDTDEDGKFYNVIESHMLVIRNKIKNYENKLKYLSYSLKSSSKSNLNNRENPKSSTDNCFSNTQNQSNDRITINFEPNKYWEDIFKIKLNNNNNNNTRSVNTNSISDASETYDVDRLFLIKKGLYSSSTACSSIRPMLKPILKKPNSERDFKKKKVSFDDNVQISFFQM